MSSKENILFITDKNYVDYIIPGGVQICTEEFINYFEFAGYNLIIIKVAPHLSFLNRIKIKLGIEAYQLYQVQKYLSQIINTIERKNIKIVLFNQLNIANWASAIKLRTNGSVKFIALSHGNESGDYIHDITNSEKKPTIIETWRIGKLITTEKLLFTKILDGVVTISEHEIFINQWLGLKNALYLPRILKPIFLNWKPDYNTIGFIGTLDHLPNYQGIDILADQLKKFKFNGIIKIVGGPDEIGKMLVKKYPFIEYCGQLDNNLLMEEVTKWSIFINPIFWYARGSSTKVAQMINWGIPVISTEAGVRGYSLVNKNFLSHKDEAESLAKLIINSLEVNSKIDDLKKIAEENATSFKITKFIDQLKLFIQKL